MIMSIHGCLKLFLHCQHVVLQRQIKKMQQNLTCGLGNIVSTDPPYYDNIGYADLSDFFLYGSDAPLDIYSQI